MFASTLSAVAILLLPLVQAANSCVSVDANFNLLAFNLAGKDYNAGPKDQWSSGSATALTASGRPPFSGANVTCHFSQFSNAVYVLGADATNPSDVHIYNAETSAWSTQKTSAPEGFDPASLTAILDHDTNVFYGLSKGELYSLALGDTLSTATSTVTEWQDVSKPIFNTDGYEPVMGLANNHIQFLNVPGVAAGSAMIFVIHFSYWQPEIQALGDFPASHGRTASMFLAEGAQKEFAFIPDSGENAYVINRDTNTTKTLTGPSTKDALASYFGTPDSLIQVTSAGGVNYIPYSTDASTSSEPWKEVSSLANVAPPAPIENNSANGPSTPKPTAPNPTVAGNIKNGATSLGSGTTAIATLIMLMVVASASW